MVWYLLRSIVVNMHSIVVSDSNQRRQEHLQHLHFFFYAFIQFDVVLFIESQAAVRLHLHPIMSQVFSFACVCVCLFSEYIYMFVMGYRF